MNLPNKLSMFRIFLIPLIVLIMIFPYAQYGIVIPQFYFEFVSLSLVNVIVLILFIIASLTDMLDGYIARRDNLITTLGKFIDPIADKLLVNSIFVVLASQGVIPVVPIVLMIARDTVVDGIRMMCSTKGIVLAAGVLGKIKTVCQMLTICVLLLNNLPFELYRFPMDDFLLWFTTFVSIVSGVSYFIQSKKVILESM